jgi:hypothetical protein
MSRGNSRRSAAASVVAQARARAAVATAEGAPDNVEILPSDRVDTSVDPGTGDPRLRVIVPGPEEPKIYDYSCWLDAPVWAPLIAEGFRIYQRGVALRTAMGIHQRVNCLAAYFVDVVDPGSVDEAFSTGLVTWLNGRRNAGEPLSETTRSKTLGALSTVVQAACAHPELGHAARLVLNALPQNPWPGRHTKQKPTAVLRPEERDAVIQACVDEIEEIRTRLDEREAILKAGFARLEKAIAAGQPADYSDTGICAATVVNLEAKLGRLTGLKDLQAYNPALRRAIQYKHSVSAIRRLIHATYRDLVPFVNLLAIKTAFNPETTQGLLLSNIKFVAPPVGSGAINKLWVGPTQFA